MSADITIHNDQKNRNEKRGYIVDPDLQNKYPQGLNHDLLLLENYFESGGRSELDAVVEIMLVVSALKKVTDGLPLFSRLVGLATCAPNQSVDTIIPYNFSTFVSLTTP